MQTLMMMEQELLRTLTAFDAGERVEASNILKAIEARIASVDPRDIVVTDVDLLRRVNALHAKCANAARAAQASVVSELRGHNKSRRAIRSYASGR